MHNIYFDTMNEFDSKTKFEERWEEIAREEGDGIFGHFDWDSYVSPKNNKEEARKYLETISENKSYYCGAVRYLDYPKDITSSKLEDIKSKIMKWNEKLHTLSTKIHYKEVKSKFISCPYCESKFNTHFINWNTCPVCGKDLRPKTTLDTISNYQRIISELIEERRKEEFRLQEKNKSKAKIKWLVRIEFHS